MFFTKPYLIITEIDLLEVRRRLVVELLLAESIPFVLYRRVPRQNHWADTVLATYDEDRFQSMVGLLKSTFLKLANVLRDTGRFDGRDQFPVQLQLAIALYRLKTSENLAKVASMFGIGDGATIQRITKRVFDAVIEQKWIYWPSQEEKVQLITESQDTLPFCLGIVDGSMSPLKFKPTLNGRFYSTYKKNYAVKWQITCDMNKKVRQFLGVLYGSIHDATVFKTTRIYTDPHLFFNEKEYIIGDSAYPLSPTCVTPYKVNTRFVTQEHRRLFNKKISKYRVRVEHCIGEIKNRFPSLNKLPIKIKSEEDIVFCSKWVTVAAMLHNFAKDNDDSAMYNIDELEEVQLSRPETEEEDEGANANGEQKRQWLYHQLVGMDT